METKWMNSVLLCFITMAIIRLKDCVVSHVNKAKWGHLSLFQGVWGFRWKPWVRGGSTAASSFIHMSGVFDIGCRLSVMGTLTWCVFVWLGFLTALYILRGTSQGTETDQDCIPFTYMVSEVMQCHFCALTGKAAVPSLPRFGGWGGTNTSPLHGKW